VGTGIPESIIRDEPQSKDLVVLLVPLWDSGSREQQFFFIGDCVYFGGCGRRRGDIGWFSGRVWSIVRTHAVGELNQDCLFCRLKDATTETEGGRRWSIVRTDAIGELNQDCLFCRLKDATTETEGGRKNPSPFLQNTACTFKRKKGFHLEDHHIFIFEAVKF
jgi:hypothetical protein